MVTYVFDASAVLRYLDGEAGTERVQQILDKFFKGDVEAYISSMHWGEVIGILFKRHGPNGTAVPLSHLRGLQLTIISVTADRAERCARIKAEYGIPYVDSLAVELASDVPDSILITADFDMKPAERFVNIEFLPAKPKPSLPPSA